MCGRARCTLNRERVAAAAGVPAEGWRDPETFQPTENLHPGFSSPVAYENEKGEREIRPMKWGLVPSFTKPSEKPDFFRMFNARCEGVVEKPVFSRLLKAHRCVVVLDGFYEWKQEGSRKQPYYIWRGEDRPLRMAGLYDVWRNEEGREVFSFTILTTDSSKRLRWLHDRMPVILRDDEAVQAWISRGQIPDAKVLQGLYEPYNEEDLVWHPVTLKMSNMGYQGPDCSKDIRQHGLGAFFKPKDKPKAVDAQPPPLAASAGPSASPSSRLGEAKAKPGANDPTVKVEDKATGAESDLKIPKEELEESSEKAERPKEQAQDVAAGAAPPQAARAKTGNPGPRPAAQRADVALRRGRQGGSDACMKREEDVERSRQLDSQRAEGGGGGEGCGDGRREKAAEGESPGGTDQGPMGLGRGHVDHVDAAGGGSRGEAGRGSGSRQVGKALEGDISGAAGSGGGPGVKRRLAGAGSSARAESAKKAKTVSPGTKQGTLDAFFTKNPL